MKNFDEYLIDRGYIRSNIDDSLFSRKEKYALHGEPYYFYIKINMRNGWTLIFLRDDALTPDFKSYTLFAGFIIDVEQFLMIMKSWDKMIIEA